MARTLTINHEENPSTNWLLTGFLLVALAWLVLGSVAAMYFSASASADEAPSVEAIAI